MHGDRELQELSGQWLRRFLGALRTEAGRSAAKAYLVGLLDPDPRKSLRAISARTGQVAYHQLHHFFDSKSKQSDGVWNEIVAYANQHFDRWPGCLTIEDIVLPKAGDKSAGVARQVLAATGKRKNCQTVVSLAMVRGGHVTPVAMHLISPTRPANPSACRGGHKTRSIEVSSEQKAIIVSEEIDTFKRRGGKVDYIIADETYFANYEFRKCLERNHIDWIACISSDRPLTVVRQQSADAYDARLSPHERISGSMLLDRKAELDRPPLYDSFVVDEPCFSANAVVHRGCGEIKKMGLEARSDMQLAVALYNDGIEYSYVSNMHVGSHVRTILRDIKNQKSAMSAYNYMKRSLGLAEYEGRSESGLRRHFLLVFIAYIYKCHLILDKYGNLRAS